MAWTASRLGQDNLSGADDALFLKVFSGEVLTAFREKNVAASRHMVRTIASGKSAQFPATWKASASYHTPGNELTGQDIEHSERVITIDDKLVADAFIDELDELKNHYDVRREYSFQLGAALARTFDENVLQTMALAARASSTLSSGDGGSKLTNANADTDMDALVDEVATAAQKLDEKDVPESDRYLFLRPSQYWPLLDHPKVIHADYTARQNGGIDTGQIRRLYGFEIVKSNNVPSTNVTSGDADYQGDFSNTVALCVQRTAVGTVKLLDLAVESEYIIERQGTLFVAKYALGHGILRPESAVEIATA